MNGVTSKNVSCQGKPAFHWHNSLSGVNSHPRILKALLSKSHLSSSCVSQIVQDKKNNDRKLSTHGILFKSTCLYSVNNGFVGLQRQKPWIKGEENEKNQISPDILVV